MFQKQIPKVDYDLFFLGLQLSVRIPNLVKRIIKPVLSIVAPRLVPVYTGIVANQVGIEDYYIHQHNLGIGGYRLRETHQLWREIFEKNLYKDEFLAYWRKLGLDLCIGPCFASPAPLSKDVGKLVRKFLANNLNHLFSLSHCCYRVIAFFFLFLFIQLHFPIQFYTTFSTFLWESFPLLKKTQKINQSWIQSTMTPIQYASSSNR